MCLRLACLVGVIAAGLLSSTAAAADGEIKGYMFGDYYYVVSADDGEEIFEDQITFAGLAGVETGAFHGGVELFARINRQVGRLAQAGDDVTIAGEGHTPDAERARRNPRWTGSDHPGSTHFLLQALKPRLPGSWPDRASERQERMTLEITDAHIDQFARDGYTIVKAGFAPDECDHFIHYMMDLQAGRTTIEGYTPRGPDDWDRLISRSLHHPLGLSWMIDPRLRAPLRTFLGDEPDGVQSMYLFKGSEQRRHQDVYHLPGCMSAWVALQEVSAHNGSIHVQVGSHKGPLIEKIDFREDEHGKRGTWYGWDHEDAFDALFERNDLPEIAVEASKGDIVFFDGRLIHRGGPILEAGRGSAAALDSRTG